MPANKMRTGARRVVSLMALPDDLLRKVANHVDFVTRRRVLPLVCKRWKGVVDTLEEWNDCCITRLMPPYTASFKQTRILRWFSKHSSGVTGLRLQHLVSDEATAGLRDSFIPVLFSILSRTLHTLVVVRCKHMLPSTQLSALASLRALRCLHMDMWQPISAQQLADVLQYMPQLRELRLSVEYFERNNKRETQQHMVLQQTRTLDHVLPVLTRLKRLEISLSARLMEVSLGRGQQPRLPHLPSYAARLRCVKLSEMHATAWPDNWFSSLGRCTNLDLSDNNIGQAPLEPMTNCSSLQRLHLGINTLRQLPPGLCQCHRLVELHLDHNLLTAAAFPAEFSALSRLTMLKLDLNRLEVLPSSFLQLPLRHLSLECNPVQTLPGGKYLQTLEYLCLKHTHWEGLPNVLSAATRLAYLDISNNEFMLSSHELLWLSANLHRNAHIRPSGLKFANYVAAEEDCCVVCCPELLEDDELHLEGVLADGEQQPQEANSDSDPFEGQDLSSSDDEEQPEPSGG